MSLIFFLAPVIILTWLYFWKRLVVTSRLSRPWKIALGLFILAILTVQIALPPFLRKHHETSVLLPLTFGILGFMDLLLFFSLFKDIFLTLRDLLFKNEDPQRRLFL